MIAESTFVREIEDATASASPSRRGEMVRKITDLFISKSQELTVEDLSIFDGVIVRLSATIEQHARALLARRLAPFRNAPPHIIRLLAYDDAIEVAGPVLSQSARLDDKTLVEIARAKGQAHMLAISHRGSLSETVTDVLVELGDREVVLNTVDNYGASFSDRGFSALVSRSEGDDVLTEFVGLRPEIPLTLLTVLVAKASQGVRAKLEASHPRAKANVRRAVAEAADRVEAQLLSTCLDYTTAQASIDSLQRAGRLDESALAAFAKAGAYAETIAALATMCDLPLKFVEQAMARDRSEALMVVAKAVGLSWSTANEILMLRVKRGIISRSEIVQRLARFEKLQSATAQEIVRVYRSRAQTKATPAG
jgi:uncharacterized protein (DUF2336 family)